MINFSKRDKLKFDKNGYIVKKIFDKNKYFLKLSNDLKNEITTIMRETNLESLGGFKSGNLNLNLGRYGEKILKLLNQKKFKFFFNYLTGDDINKYKIQFGGNLNLPKSKNQLFHIDGPWIRRMLILNIATTNINRLNGPMEIYEKSHQKNYPYWKFHIQKFFMKKKKIKLNYGEILFREHRLWHRGTKNHSTNYREMVGIMFLKKNLERNNIINKTTKNIEIFSNIFGTTKRERIKEFVFFYFKFIIFFYKFLISIKF